jgi:general nucleoside transport system ATP-binding protein
MSPVLELREIEKSFGSVHAVRGADFLLQGGQLHALLGENGAGKTTLMHIAAGVIQPDRGRIAVQGQEVSLTSPREARRLGIGMVHQHFTSIPAFSVGENIALASGWPLAPGRLRERVAKLFDRAGVRLDQDADVGSLTVAALGRLEILKVLSTDATILLLDEPTGSLPPTEAAELLAFFRRLVDGGSSAVLITHKLEEALVYADHITVLRRGRVTLSDPVASLDRDRLTEAMLGEMISPTRVSVATTGAPVVRAERLGISPGSNRGPGLTNATFEIRAGETVGVAAVQGNGEHELLRSVAGLIQPAAGTLVVERPVSFVPENRTSEGLIGEFSLAENLTLGLERSAAWVQGGLVNWSRAHQETAGIIERHGIVAAGPRAPAASLSGGNQQKLVLARALEANPRVVVAENPGRGLDIRSSRAAYERLREAARKGAGVLIYSSDLDELVEWCDRIVVVARGEVHGLAPGVDRDTIGRLMLSVRA